MNDIKLKDSGERQTFRTGAVRDTQNGKGRYDLLPFHSIFRVSRIFEEGAKKYAPDNWRKGIPLRRYLDSALRHLCRFAHGARDEDHIAQAAWNILCLMETEYMINQKMLPQELNDLPNFIGENDPQTKHSDQARETRIEIEKNAS